MQIYLDHNATTALRPEAKAAVVAALEVLGNPSSLHGFGRKARRVVEDAREAVARLAGGRPQDTVFTGSGSEANNLALVGAARPRVLVSGGEHDCVLKAVPGAEILPLQPSGVLDLAALKRALAADSRPAIVAVMLANNETGVLQPLAEIAAIAKRHGALLHCDAVQAAGKVPLDLAALGVDSLALSAHKLGGPQGVGALVLRAGHTVQPLLRGGGQERSRRAGTENTPGIAGFGAAAEAALRDLPKMSEIATWREEMESGLKAIAPEVVILGQAAPRLATTTAFALPGWSAERQLMALDLAGIAVSSGSACSSGKVTPSHVLAAMGVSEELSRTALRVSLGWCSRREEVSRFVELWGDLYRRRTADRSPNDPSGLRGVA